MSRKKVQVQITSKESYQPKETKSQEDWENSLSPDQYSILRDRGTERPFTGIYDKHFKDGKYQCAGCGSMLFESTSKFDSGCGWPSFDAPESDEKITYFKDTTHGMTRIEIVCTNCGGHLGHVFDDGPTDTGLRYCVNSASLNFTEE